MQNQKWFFSLLILAVSACSKNQNLLQERQRTTPPQGKKDVGVIMEGAQPAQVESLLAAHPGAKVRVLNTQHGMYEIFGVESEKVREEYSGPSSKNEFFELRPRKAVQAFSVDAPEGMQVGNLNPCVSGADVPEAILSVALPTPAAVEDGATIELGQSLKVNGLSSQATPVNSSALKMVTVLEFPEATGKPQLVQNGTAMAFTPDTLGLHTIYLVVQDGKNVCAMDRVRVIVTANRPFLGPGPAIANVDLGQFKHLPMVSAQNSWAVSRGDGIIIAIVDTGVNYNQALLSPNILVNDKEIPADGIDNDKNGFIDDYVGYDLENQDPFPYDDDSHGTHVAGLAAAKQMGMASNAKILPVKALSSLGGDVGTIAAAIRYAVDRGANIVNLSLGAEAPSPHPALVSAADYAEQKGVLLVVAAGNGDEQTGLGFSIEDHPVFPASLKNANILAVAAFDSLNVLSPYSNFGAKSVHVVAPGGFTDDLIYSTAFENPKGEMFIGMAGTSMATPIVSGIAAQVWSHTRSLSVQEVKGILIQAGTPFADLKGITVSGKHIDSLSALATTNARNVLF